MTFQKSLLALAVAGTLVACGEDGELFGSSDKGRITLALTDAPVESAAKVVVTFDQIELKRADDEALTFTLRSTDTGCEAVEEGKASSTDEACSLDLLTLASGKSVVLLNEKIKKGSYTQIRLGVVAGSDTYIELDDGRQFPLNIPSAEQTGLKLVHNFTVDADTPVAFTIDFDVRKSLVLQGNGKYKLRPTLRIVETAAAAKIVGTVDESKVVEPFCGGQDYINGPAGVVYVFPGHQVLPDDIDSIQGDDAEPISTTPVVYDPATATFSYHAAFLPAGDYTVAYTCAADDPEANETLRFSAPVKVTLAKGETKTVRIEAD